MTGADGADVLRVLVVSVAGLTIGLAGYIAVSYTRSYIAIEPVRRMMRWGPLQVAALAVAHAAYTAYAAHTIVELTGTPLSWESPYLAATNVVSMIALLGIARRERNRIASARRAAQLGYPRRRAEDR